MCQRYPPVRHNDCLLKDQLSRMFPSKPGISVKLLISLALISYSAVALAPAQNNSAPIRIKGSFVIAAICRDGIIVASDSRATLKDKHGRRIAYYDNNQKIFPVGNSLIAGTGYASLNDPKISFLSSLMSGFASNPLSRADVDQLANAYFKYANLVLLSAGAESAKVQTLVFAGYEKGRPMLCLYQGEASRATTCRSEGYVSSPRQPIVGLEKASSLSFREAAKILQKTIEDYESAVQPGSVGGPVVVRTITRSHSQWFSNHPDWPTWNSFADLASDYKAGRISFRLMPGIEKRELNQLIEDGDTWARVGQSEQPSAGAPSIGSSHADH